MRSVQNALLDGAFVAISGVSAVLWTGGLIVLQLRRDDHAPSDHTTSDLIKSAMACIAFPMLAPLFSLFEAGTLLRATAMAFTALYLYLTINNPIRIARMIWHRHLEAPTVVIDMLFFLPTVAMAAIVAFPFKMTIAVCSLVFVFVGYFVLSASVNVLGRSK